MFMFHVREYVAELQWLTTCLHAAKQVADDRSILHLYEPWKCELIGTKRVPQGVVEWKEGFIIKSMSVV